MYVCMFFDSLCCFLTEVRNNLLYVCFSIYVSCDKNLRCCLIYSSMCTFTSNTCAYLYKRYWNALRGCRGSNCGCTKQIPSSSRLQRQGVCWLRTDGQTDGHTSTRESESFQIYDKPIVVNVKQRLPFIQLLNASKLM